MSDEITGYKHKDSLLRRYFIVVAGVVLAVAFIGGILLCSTYHGALP